MHQRCFNYTLTNLLFSLCKSVWVIDFLVNLPSPHPEVPAHLFTLEVLRTRERTPTPLRSTIITFELAFESIKEVGGVLMCVWLQGYLELEMD
jgi:hypothetical protein